MLFYLIKLELLREFKLISLVQCISLTAKQIGNASALPNHSIWSEAPCKDQIQCLLIEPLYFALWLVACGTHAKQCCINSDTSDKTTTTITAGCLSVITSVWDMCHPCLQIYERRDASMASHSRSVFVCTSVRSDRRPTNDEHSLDWSEWHFASVVPFVLYVVVLLVSGIVLTSVILKCPMVCLNSPQLNSHPQQSVIFINDQTCARVNLQLTSCRPFTLVFGHAN